MIRAMILWLLGATFEVRMISLKTGKIIPGRCMYRGGYWQARKVFKRQRLKNRYLVRLQAFTTLDSRQNIQFSLTEAQDKQNQITNERLDNIKTAMAGQGQRGVNPMADGMPPLANVQNDIGESNARQSEFMHEHQDELNVYQGEDKDDHECDSTGPLEFDKALGYVPTCSVCEAKWFQPVDSEAG